MEGFCRGCLIKYDEPTDLIPYSEKNRRLFVYSTSIQVKRNDAFTFQLCKDCYLKMKESCRFKKVCRTSEKKFKNYIALKDDGDVMDFSMFLKNSDESLTLQLPLASGNSTPAHHKIKDDDNESTCTSIRNFMSDILQGEEVPDNEARIIKELFEEEADVLDDSLDSHWLQEEDDMSIATDFRMDFTFSPFSTPRSINNDHCYTPHRINDDKYTDKSPNPYHNMPNMPLLEVDECAMDLDHVADIPMDNIPTDIYRTNLENNVSVNDKDVFNKNKHIKLGIDLDKDNSNMLIDKVISVQNHGLYDKHKEMELEISLDQDNNVLVNNHLKVLNEDLIQLEEIVPEDAVIEKDLLNIEDDSAQEFIAPTEIENDFFKMADEHVKKKFDESIFKNELDYYIDKVDMKRKNGDNSKCSIDRNLELALLNEQNKEFSLEQLITSPRVSINSGASTPTIRNIIFGSLEQIPKNEIIENHNNLKEELMNEDDLKILDKINNTDPLSLRSCLETVPIRTEDKNSPKEILNTDTDNKQEIEINTENSIDDIFTLINKDSVENLQDHIIHKDTNTDHNYKNKKDIETKDIKDLIEDYVTNVYDNADTNHNEIEDLLETGILGLKGPETPKIMGQYDKTIEKTDVFKKPMQPDEQYDLENGLCKLCDKKFNSEQALRIHFSKIHKVRITPRKRKYPTEICTICNKTFKGKANLIRHTKEAHSDIKVNHYCKICSLEFKTQYALNLHRRIHDEYAPKKDHKKYLCTFCGKYLNLSNHRLHQLKHQNIYKFKCDQCNLKFNREWELKRHIRTHSKEQPYACNFCSKAYSRRDMLKVHLQVHFGRKFSCDECGSRFKTKSCIKKHLITSVCPDRKEKFKVSLDNVILKPLKKNENRIMITDVKIIKNADLKPIKRSDDKPINRIDDKPINRIDDKPINRIDDKYHPIED